MLDSLRCERPGGDSRGELRVCFGRKLFAQSTTSMPMLRAVPAMILMPAASSLAFMSAFLIFQISASCFLVTLPTLSWLGFAEPEAMLAAFFKRTDAGGDFRMNVKLLSLNTVITTGRIM